MTLLDVYKAVEVVDEGELFQIHESPNPDCPIGANIQAVLELILCRAQSAMEQVLAEIKLSELTQVLIKNWMIYSIFYLCCNYCGYILSDQNNNIL